MPALFKKMLERKLLSLGLIIVLVGVVYWGYGHFFGTAEIIKYATAHPARGTVIVSVSGSGQVSASNQLDVKSKVAGNVIFVGVKKGQAVKTGAVIAKIDDTDARKTVRDAEINLESSKLSLEKLKKPADKLSVLQAESAVAQAKESKDEAERTLKEKRKSFEDLKAGATKLEILQAENSLEQAKQDKSSAEEGIKKAYEDGFNTVSNTFIELPSLVAGLKGIFFDAGTFTQYQINLDWYTGQISGLDARTTQYSGALNTKYRGMREKYDTLFKRYQGIDRTSVDRSTVESLINDTYDTIQLLSESLRAGSNFMDLFVTVMSNYSLTYPSTVTTHKTNLDSYTTKINTHLQNLFSARQTLKTKQDSLAGAERSVADKTESLAKLKAGPDELELMQAENTLAAAERSVTVAERSIAEKAESFAKLKAGTDPLDIRSSELTLRQRENSLADSKEQLADYSIRAPFNGVIAKIDIKKGDEVSAQTVMATIITAQKIAELSFNEVDITRIKEKQKAILTFDAVPDLSISGEVAELDSLGTVSQGVVTYAAKIIFDTQDDRVKPSMSVSASIIVDSKTDVLTVPNAAVKSQNGSGNYVEYFDEADFSNAADIGNQSGVEIKTLPKRKQVEIGIANDDVTEIVGGLTENDIIVTRTIKQSTTTTSSNGSPGGGAFRIPGMGGGGPR